MSSLSKGFGLPSSLDEEFMVTKKQGIVSILGSDCERSKSAASIRRTISADMSSKKWLSQHGFSPLKKIASSEEFPLSISDSCSSSSQREEDYDDGRQKETDPQGQFEIWSSIQEDRKEEEEELEKPGQFDIWSSILFQKAQEDNKTLPPYVHPLVRRSASSLSEKSLEICTESLGSETGSDGFSSYSPSETGDPEEEKEEEQEESKVAQKYEDINDWCVAKYNIAAANKKLPQRSFPPPLTSLSRGDGTSLHMRPRRDSGRLVLQIVYVPSQKNLRAVRQDNRLVLSFINDPNEGGQNKEDMELYKAEIENSDEEEGTKTEEVEEALNERRGGDSGGEVRFVMEEAPKVSSRATSVHRLALMVNKPTALVKGNPTWPKNFNETVRFEEAGEKTVTQLPQSLPPRLQVSRMIPKQPAAAATSTVKAAASFNAYEYYWKSKPMTTVTATCTVTGVAAGATSSSPMIKKSQSIKSKNLTSNEKQELLVLRRRIGEYLVPLSKNCKEPRSLLFWEPCCIATS